MSTLDLRQRRIILDHAEFRGEFALRRLDPARDLELVHSWMNDPEVARFWKMPWPRDQIASYLQRLHRSAHCTAYLGDLDGTPMSYWELYRADLDPLARHYSACDHDTGVHGLLGPASYRGHGLAVILMEAITGWLLDADPKAGRVVTEPDIANERAIRILQRAGFHRAAVVDLPNKRAALMIRDREQH